LFLGSFVYVESWKAIEIANAVFGFDGWSSEIINISPDFVHSFFLFIFPSYRLSMKMAVLLLVSQQLYV
jgi:recombination DNA repair RAD52 pathway protein